MSLSEDRMPNGHSARSAARPAASLFGASLPASFLAAALLAFAPTGASAGTVKVESKGMQRVYKRTSTKGGVRLRKQLSREACVQGVSWGFDRDGIWVDQGCRAEFETGTPAASGEPATGRIVTVESEGMQREVRYVSTRGGVRLRRQLSREACVEGVSWGFDRESVWVDKGCRAELEIGGASTSGTGSLFGGPSTVKVESKGMQRTYKRTSTKGGVRLSRQLSREACVEGVSWGFDRDGIWVDQGCRAEFQVGR
jgi:hypothetical protein